MMWLAHLRSKLDLFDYVLFGCLAALAVWAGSMEQYLVAFMIMLVLAPAYAMLLFQADLIKGLEDEKRELLAELMRRTR